MYTDEDFIERSKCPMCGSVVYDKVYDAAAEGADAEEGREDERTVGVVRCKGCGFVYAQEIFSCKGSKKFWQFYSSRVHEPGRGGVVDNRNQMYRLEYDFISQFLEDGRCNSVLDVGCAEGRFLDYFSGSCDCCGVEVGEEAAGLACERYRVFEGELPELHIDTTFDLIIFRGVIQYFQEPVKYFEKADELLKPGGLLYITSTPDADAFLHKIFGSHFTLPVCAVACNGFSAGLLKRYFGRKGYALCGEKYFYEETPYANVENDLEITGRALAYLREGKKIDFKAPAFWGNMMTLVLRKGR